MPKNCEKVIGADCPAANTRSKKQIENVDYSAIERLENNLIPPATDKNQKIKDTFVDFVKAVKERADEDGDDDAESYESWMDEYDEEEIQWLKEQPEKERDTMIAMEKELILKFKGSVPTRFKILESDHLPDFVKHIAIQKVRRLMMMDDNDDSRGNIEEWINILTSIPFGKIVEPKVSKMNPVSDIITHLKESQERLNRVVYGHDDTKAQILEYIANTITNPKVNGKCLAIQGPPGNGKTTIMRYGLADVLGRPFYQINLGGLKEASALTGSSPVYIGSTVGKILQALRETHCMNPVILFDELDKVESDAIFNVLCHITDYTQNTTFSDRYLEEVKVDLSKVMFVFTFNDISAVNPVLLDRLHVIRTEGFNSHQKVRVAQDYLVPKIMDTYGFTTDDITVSDEVISQIIHDHCGDEKGVRSLQRYLEGIASKINLIRLTGGSIQLPYVKGTLEFPLTIDYELANRLIKTSQANEKKHLSMYM